MIAKKVVRGVSPAAQKPSAILETASTMAFNIAQKVVLLPARYIPKRGCCQAEPFCRRPSDFWIHGQDVYLNIRSRAYREKSSLAYVQAGLFVRGFLWIEHDGASNILEMEINSGAISTPALRWTFARRHYSLLLSSMKRSSKSKCSFSSTPTNRL